MVRLSQKKKAIVVPFLSAPAVLFRIENPLAIVVNDLFLELNRCTNLQEQTSILQSRKGALRKLILSQEDSEDMHSSISALLFAFLNPDYSPLRKCFEWLVESLSKRSTSFPSVIVCVRSTCKKLWTAASISSFESLSLDTLTAWAYSFASVAAIEKDVPWLTYCDGYENDTFLELVTELSAMLWHVVQHLKGQMSSDSRRDSTNPSSAEFVHLSECCGEVARALMVVFKSSRKAGFSMSSQGVDKALWSILSGKLIQHTLDILASPFLQRDVLTSVANTLVSVQWIWTTHDENEKAVDEECSVNGLLAMRQAEGIIVSVSGSEKISSEILKLGVHPKIESRLRQLPDMARLAIVRACLTVYEFNLVKLEVFSSWDMLLAPANMLLGVAFEAIVVACRSSQPDLRLYGVQTIESLLNRLSHTIAPNFFGLFATDPGENHVEELAEFVSLLISRMRQLSVLLMAGWSHPVKQLSHTVPSVYEKLVVFFADIVDRLVVMPPILLRFRGFYSSVSFSSNALADGDHVSSSSAKWLWKPFIEETLLQPAQHRGRYQALTILLPRVGAQAVLASQENVIATLIEGVRIRDVCSSSCSFVGTLLRQLVSESLVDDSENADRSTVVTRIRSLWDKSLVTVLLMPDRTRMNAADYLVPEFLAVDPSAAPHLIALIKKAPAGYGNKLWALVSVVLHARLRGLPGDALSSDSDDDERCLSLHEAFSACLSDDTELRLAALTMMTASFRTSAPIPDEDLLILKRVLRHSLKSSQSDHRQAVARVVKAILTRSCESARAASRDLAKALGRREVPKEDICLSSSGDAATSASLSTTQINIEANIKVFERILTRFDEVCSWLSEELLLSLYPGSNFDNEIMALDLMHQIFDVFSSTGVLKFTQVQYFFSGAFTKTLLSLAVSTWDRTRQMSCELLLQYPRPLSGYSDPAAAQVLLARGLALAGSARQRESDSGALLIKIVFSVYVLNLGWDLSDSSSFLRRQSGESSASSHKQNISTVCANFIGHLSSVFKSRIAGLEELFATIGDINELLTGQPSAIANRSYMQVVNTAYDEGKDLMGHGEEEKPLCHGIVLAIRYCLLQAHQAGVLDTEIAAIWRERLCGLFTTSIRAMHSAMTVVAEAKSDVPFSVISPTIAGTSAAVEGVKGPVSVAACESSSMAASYMNTNGAMGVAGYDEGEEGCGGGDIQRAVVAAWLLIKEVCAILTLLVELSPPPPPSTNASTLSAEVDDPSAVAAAEDASQIYSIQSKVNRAKAKKHASIPLLTIEEVAGCGDVILDALGRLKHMGAIAEAHAGLQKITETLLGHGERCVELCRLPSKWLQALISRLHNEKQVFILRRSAGFAYSFLSLLRAEPLKSKPVLFIRAMESLISHVEEFTILSPAEVAVGGVDSGSVDDATAAATEGGWRTRVHALNVLRLIITDAAFGANMDPFISRATIIAIRGFKSPKWAVRNSSMMLFSSVVQRVVHKDKNDSGGAKSMTVSEFFTRFPALFPFLLKELADITNYNVLIKNDWPIKVVPTVTDDHEISVNTVGGYGISASHPALYPILLILSKMRAPRYTLVDETSRFNGSERRDQDNATDTTTPKPSLDMSASALLFCPLVESCCAQKVQKVREMAAKAYSSLIPLQRIPAETAAIFSSLVEAIKHNSFLTFNEKHGRLLLALELMENIRKHMDDIGNSDSFFSPLKTELRQLVFPVLEKLQRQLAKPLVLIRQARATPRTNQTGPQTYLTICPPVHRVFLKLLLCFNEIIDCKTSQSSMEQIKPPSLDTLMSEDPTEVMISRACFVGLHGISWGTTVEPVEPYAPLLWREALASLVPLTVKEAVRTRILLKRFVLDSFPTASCLPSLSLLISLLDHGYSEVRCGILEGFLTAVNLFVDHPEDILSILKSQKFTTRLLKIIEDEREPPIASLSLKLMLRLLQASPLVKQADSIKAVFIMAWSKLTTKVNISLSQAPAEAISIAPTTVAAYVIELLGHIIACEVDSSVGGVYSSELGRLFLWVSILEAAGDQEQSSEHRARVAASIAASRVLQWLTLRAKENKFCCGGGSDYVSSLARREEEYLLSTLACRMWLLVVKLIQDDDEDVRNTVNGFLTQLKSVCGGDTAQGEFPIGFTTVQSYTVEIVPLYLSWCLLWSIRVGGGGVGGLEAVVGAWEVYSGVSNVAVQDHLNLVATDSHLEQDSFRLEHLSRKVVFDAEQANLFIEPAICARIAADAFALALADMSLTGQQQRQQQGEHEVEVGEVIVCRVTRHILTALHALRMLSNADINEEFICGKTYEPAVFSYIFNALYIFERILSSVPRNEWSALVGADMEKALDAAVNDIYQRPSLCVLHSWIIKILALIRVKCV